MSSLAQLLLAQDTQLYSYDPDSAESSSSLQPHFSSVNQFYFQSLLVCNLVVVVLIGKRSEESRKKEAIVSGVRSF